MTKTLTLNLEPLETVINTINTYKAEIFESFECIVSSGALVFNFTTDASEVRESANGDKYYIKHIIATKDTEPDGKNVDHIYNVSFVDSLEKHNKEGYLYIKKDALDGSITNGVITIATSDYKITPIAGESPNYLLATVLIVKQGDTTIRSSEGYLDLGQLNLSDALDKIFKG
jgi:hypothetical protein